MTKLTADEISAVYEEIGKMRVELSPDASRGLQYVKERLTLCRAMQDRLAELTLKVNRALSTVMAEELTLKMKYHLTPETATQQQMQLVGGEKQDHILLTKMLKMQSQLLSRTAMDVRLLADLTKEQLKLGEIDPKDAPELVQQVSVEDISSFPAKVNGDAEISVPFDGPSGIISATEAVGAPPSQDVPIDFEDLFGDLNGETTARPA